MCNFCYHLPSNWGVAMQQLTSHSALKLALLNYAGAAAFAAIIGVISWGTEDPSNLIVLKAVFAPFFLLASRSLPTFFKEPVNMAGFNPKSVETQILSALLVAGFFVITMWNPGRSLGQMSSDFWIMFLTMTIANLAILAWRARRTKALQSQE